MFRLAEKYGLSGNGLKKFVIGCVSPTRRAGTEQSAGRFGGRTIRPRIFRGADGFGPGRAVADGLVLTKWKKAAEAGDATGKFAEARRRILRRAKGKALWVVQSEQSPGFAEMDF